MYTVYKTTHVITGHFYIGVHKTNKPDDKYLGSGIHLKRAIEKYGRSKFSKEILFIFDDMEKAYQKEKEILQNHLGKPECYNIQPGGFGGWDHIRKNPNYMNPMKNPIIAKKVSDALKKKYGTYGTPTRKYNSHPPTYDEKVKIAMQNLQKAIQSNIGRKRPEQACVARRVSQQIWKNKEEMRDKLASTFRVVSPTGETIITNRLQDFCNKHNLTYTVLWKTSKTGKSPNRGKSKGWICYKI